MVARKVEHRMEIGSVVAMAVEKWLVDPMVQKLTVGTHTAADGEPSKKCLERGSEMSTRHVVRHGHGRSRLSPPHDDRPRSAIETELAMI